MDRHAPTLDCLIVGAGAAGLTAAVYLARFRRRIQVIDAGTSRIMSIPASHNYPGFSGGIHGPDLLQRLRAQADHYGARIENAAVERLERLDDGVFIASTDDRQWRARHVILATGVIDVEPDFPDVKRAVAQGCVRYCPICDGFESIGKKVAVVGRGKNGYGEALFIRHFASEVSLLSLTEPLHVDAREHAKLDAAGVRVIRDPVESLAFDEVGDVDRVGKTNVMRVHLRGGERVGFDVVYAALGTLVNSGLAHVLGAACNEGRELTVDAHQQTSVDGLYAAGDIVAGLNQITVAMGHAAIAATAIHNRLNQWRD